MPLENDRPNQCGDRKKEIVRRLGTMGEMTDECSKMLYTDRQVA